MLTDQQHPITPPPDLVQQWWEEAHEQLSPYYDYIATQAARWGFRQCIKADAAWLENKLQKARDQELEACIDVILAHPGMARPELLVEVLRAARRPKPPSLAEQALEEIQQMEGAMYSADLGCDFTATRAALERLQHLEQESNDN